MDDGTTFEHSVPVAVQQGSEHQRPAGPVARRIAVRVRAQFKEKTMKYLTSKPAAVLLGAVVMPLALGAAFFTLQAPAGAQVHSGSIYGERVYDERNFPRVVTGVVTRQGLTDRRFELRTDTGRTLLVRPLSTSPLWLNVGDRIEITGATYVNNGNYLFQADRIRIIEQVRYDTTQGGSGEKVDFRATIVDFQADNRFTVRPEGNNDLYTVESRTNVRAVLNRGDRVNIVGRLFGRRVVGEGITRIAAGGIDDGGWDNNDDRNDRTEFRGTVERILNQRRVEVRATDNRIYTVNLVRDLNPRVRVGDTVRVIGDIAANSVVNSGRIRRGTAGGWDGNDDDWDDGQDGNERVEFRGTVARILSNTRVEVRGTDNRIYTVNTDNALNPRIGVGDEVRVTGRIGANSTVYSANVRRDRDGDDDDDSGNERVEFRGTVSRIVSNTRVEVRGTDNRIYTVNTVDTLNPRIGIGDEVRVTGRIGANSTVYSANVRRDRDADDDDIGNAPVEFRGTVSRILTNRQVEVRGTDNRIYTLQLERAIDSRIGVGDNVRVVGRIGANSVVYAASIYRTGGSGDSGGSGTDQVEFQGTLARINNNRQVEVRGTDNRLYTVNLIASVGSRFNIGDTLRVVGRIAANSVVNAATISRVGWNGNGGFNPAGGRAVDFNGVITGKEIGAVTVRADNGSTYRIRYSTGLQVGTRVRVIGQTVNGVISATSINRE